VAIPYLGILVIIVMIIASAIRVLREYERAVVFRLGRLIGEKGPGLIFLIPLVDRMVRVSLRVVAMDVAPQDIITKDNVSVKVNAVVYFRVMDANKAINEVEDFLYATTQLAQTTLRSVLGQVELDQLLSEREEINRKLQQIIDEQTDAWGVKVSLVEVKHVDLPTEMQRAIARQAEAERERRSKVIHADGEFQASARLREAADIMATNPTTLQLRFLQTLTEVATEKNSTIVFPLPIDLFRPLMEKMSRDSS
jgi:regulator of protease activity HflC (stomatin/prohibitin superfamily)